MCTQFLIIVFFSFEYAKIKNRIPSPIIVSKATTSTNKQTNKQTLYYWSCISLVVCFSDETLHLYIMSSPGHLRHLLADHCLASPQRTNRGWQLHTSGEAKRTRFAGRLHENEKESGTECLLQERLQRTTQSGAPHIHWQSRLRVCSISSILCSKYLATGGTNECIPTRVVKYSMGKKSLKRNAAVKGGGGGGWFAKRLYFVNIIVKTE